MATYYFNVRTQDENAPSRQRHELPDLRQALVLAQRTARLLIRRQVRHSDASVRGNLDIEDERGRPLARIPLADVARQAF